MRSLITLAVIVSLHAIGFSATIYVPDDYSTIQDAINASANGDTVIVRPDTYVENIDFLGKDIIVTSEMGPDVTTIDGSGSGYTVTFAGGEPNTCTLEGFTITNGLSSMWGGGINITYSHPTIAGNVITGNKVDSLGGGWAFGGGIYMYGSLSTITDNIISGNKIIDQVSGSAYGGGLYIDGDSDGLISGNVISGNKAYVESTGWALGGGIYVYASAPTITGNTITGNIAETSGAGSAYGAGINCSGGSSPLIGGNTVTDNACITNGGWGSGGGIYCYSSVPDITGNTVSGNAGIYGGGIHLAYCGSGAVTNNIVHGNGTSAQTMGGGIYLDNSTADITNNTVAENAAGWGGGFYATESCFPNIVNTIFWGNEVEEIFIGFWSSSSTVTISYSDVEGGLSGCYVDPSCTLDWGSGMIDSDPLFVDPAASDFHLTCRSPCYGAGDNAAPALPLEDFEGDPRVIHGDAEIGADEYFCHLYLVGSPVPGNTVSVCVAAIPWQDVTLYRGSGALEFPYWTGHGFLYIEWPAIGSWNLGKIPVTGVMIQQLTIPASWVPGESYFFQAQVGDWGFTHSWLTNLLVVEAE